MPQVWELKKKKKKSENSDLQEDPGLLLCRVGNIKGSSFAVFVFLSLYAINKEFSIYT